MSLSDKRQPIIATEKGKYVVHSYSYPEEDVKAFIKELKERMIKEKPTWLQTTRKDGILDIIDEVAGSALI